MVTHSWNSMTKRERILYDCANISSGTLATLTDLHKYDDLDKIHRKFVAYVKKSHTSYPNWQSAWKAFEKRRVK